MIKRGPPNRSSVTDRSVIPRSITRFRRVDRGRWDITPVRLIRYKFHSTTRLDVTSTLTHPRRNTTE